MLNRLVFRAFDGKSVRYDITGFEHGKENEMAGVFIDGSYYRIVDSIINDETQLHPCAIVDQFTGLLDKNGVKIFEGDVVHLQWIHNYTGSIEFRHGTFCMVSAEKELIARTLGELFAHNICVIGNIHCNPELLEKK